MARALYHIDLNLKKEYELWINELLQTVVVFGIVHILQILQDPTREFLNDNFLQALIFTLIGFSFYFLIWKKMFEFVYEDEENGLKGTLKLF